MCHFGLVAISRTSCREAARREVLACVSKRKRETPRRSESALATAAALQTRNEPYLWVGSCQGT